jgi:glutaredoxin-related protein
MRRLPTVKAIPQIFIGGEHVGGYEDLEVLWPSGSGGQRRRELNRARAQSSFDPRGKVH